MNEDKPLIKTLLTEVLVTLVLALAIFFIIQSVIQSSVVLYSSMEPNLEEGQRIIISKIVYNFHEPERGDIIIFPSPGNSDEEYVKRIIGLPGERVEMIDGIVYIHQPDGTILTLDETNYITSPDIKHFSLSDIIPEDEYFVLGDNRNNSEDSRYGWTVPRSDIVGKAWLLIWPFSDWGLAANHSFSEIT